MNKERKIEVEKVESVPPPPRARVPESAAEKYVQGTSAASEKTG